MCACMRARARVLCVCVVCVCVACVVCVCARARVCCLCARACAFLKLFLGIQVDSKLGATQFVCVCVRIHTGLFEMIVGDFTTCHTQYT